MSAQAKDEFGGIPEQLQSALDASGVVGAWDWDLVRRIARYDRGAAELLALDPNLAGRDIRGDMAMVGIHPDDRAWLRSEVERAAGVGGVFLSEYRVVSARGEVRWLLSRGRIYQDPHGRPVRSKGILIDITESRDESRGYVTMPKERVQHPLDRAASLMLEARKALDEAGVDVPAHVRVALDLALFEVGTQIARRSRH